MATTTPTQFVTVPFDQISEPGAYICNWNGFLLQVPSTGISSNGTPWVNIVGNETLNVTKISDESNIAVSKAREIAATAKIVVNF